MIVAPHLSAGWTRYDPRSPVGAAETLTLDGWIILRSYIVGTVTRARKAVKWNSPFYGVAGPRVGHGAGWFLRYHCFTKYVKVAFFRPGAPGSLRPLPPGESKQKEVRYPPQAERPARPSSTRRLGEASQPIARRTNVSGQCEVRAWPERWHRVYFAPKGYALLALVGARTDGEEL